MFFEDWKGTNQILPWSKDLFFSAWQLRRFESRIYLALISDLTHRCRAGNPMSGFVGYVSFSVVTFGFKIKIHRSNNGISAVSLKSSTVRCEPRMRLLATVNFFVWNFLTVKVMNWICKLENWKGRRWKAH